MPRREMEELLAQLRKEVAGDQQLSDSQRARMDALREQLEDSLAAEEAPRDDNPRELVRNYIDEFHRTHPTLTMVLGRILDSLNKMGI
jgi:hypothetical protein